MKNLKNVFVVLLLITSSASFSSIVFAQSNKIIPPAPAPVTNVGIECQFYSYDSNSITGSRCFDVDNSSYSCVTTADSVYISSISSPIPFLNRNYYGSKCNFSVPSTLSHSPTENSISVQGYCDKVLSSPETDNKGTPNYFRFYCGATESFASSLTSTPIIIVLVLLLIIVSLLILKRKK